MKLHTRKIKLDPSELADLLDDDQMPSKKKAAATIIDLRTRLEVRTLFLTVSLGLNMAFITAKLVR